jgi:recombination DNA repair RAD52 pathway protein
MNSNQSLIVRDCERLGIEMKLSKINVDYIDVCQNGHFDVCVSVICTLLHKGGNQHQDIGCGVIENCPDKATAIVLARRVGQWK